LVFEAQAEAILRKHTSDCEIIILSLVVLWMQEVGCCLELGSGCSQVASAGANENIFFVEIIGAP